MWREHWSDEQFIAHLYGVGPDDGHLTGCEACRLRFEEIQARRENVAALAAPEEVPTDFLAAQRRAIYARLDEKPFWLRARHWAPALATIVLAVGLVWNYQSQTAPEPSDAELVQQVSQIAENATPSAVAPIEALFEE